MRKVQMMMFMTIDGQAQFPLYSGPPYDAPEDELMWTPHWDKIDTIILGRNSYEKWAQHWPKRLADPKAGEWEKDFARFSGRAKKVVFSKSLRDPTWENTEIVRGTPREELARLRSQKGGNIALGGGPRIAQSFLADDLVDEMLILVTPSIVGQGKHLFRTADDPDFAEDRIPEGAPGRHDFILREARGLKDATVFLHYERRPK